MEWKRYISILRRWLWLLVLAACMSAIIGWAFIVSSGQDPAFAPFFISIAALLGLVWALAGVFGIEYATDNIRVPEDLHQISGVQLLGVIPTVRRGSRSFLETPGTQASAVYRTAAMGLLPSPVNSHHGRTILVCPTQETPLSAQAAANLGMSFARLGHPTLLIDADRMHGQLTRALNLQGQPGFADALSNPSSDVMLHLVPSVPNMYVLPAGAAPAVEPMTFSMPYLRNLVDRSGSEGSMIMVAGPPAAPSALVALGLAKSVHDVVLVAVKDETKRRTLRRSVQTLQQSGAHLAGILLMERPGSYKYDDMPVPAAIGRSSTIVEDTETVGGYERYREYEPALPVQSHMDPYEDAADFVEDEPSPGAPSNTYSPSEDSHSRGIQQVPISDTPVLDLDSLDAGTTPPVSQPLPDSSIDLSGLDNLRGPVRENGAREMPSIDFSSLDTLGGELAAEQGPKRHRVSPLLGAIVPPTTIPVQQPAVEETPEEPPEAELLPSYPVEEEVEPPPLPVPTQPQAEEVAPPPVAVSAQPETVEPAVEPTYYDPTDFEMQMWETEALTAPSPVPEEVQPVEPVEPVREAEPVAEPVQVEAVQAEPTYTPPAENETAPEPVPTFSQPEIQGPAFWLEVDPISSWIDTLPAEARVPQEVTGAPPVANADQALSEEETRVNEAPAVADYPLEVAPAELASTMAEPQTQVARVPSGPGIPTHVATVIAKWFSARRLDRELARSNQAPRKRRSAPSSQPVGTSLKLAGAKAIHTAASMRQSRARRASTAPPEKPGAPASAAATATDRDWIVPTAPPTTRLSEGDLVTSWLQTAEHARKQGNIREAKELVNRVLDLDPRNEDAWHMRLRLADTGHAASPRQAAVARPLHPQPARLRVPAWLVVLVVVVVLAAGAYAGWPLVSSLAKSGSPSNPARLATPTSAVVAQASPTLPAEDNTYDVSGAFLTFWGANGAEKILGNPVSPRIQETDSSGATLEVQYFERARLELHPEAADPSARVTLGRIGSEVPVTGTITNPLPQGLAGDMVTFKETGFEVPQKFDKFWQANNGAVLFGYPLTPVLNDVTLDGKPVVVQYFERARLEYHPEAAGTAKEVQLTDLGSVVYAIKHPR